jgi:aminoglycoside phosphotransferase (APT) family kinase protein
MHADELELDAGLVRRLVAEQFPHWAELLLERVPSGGTDNALFRLGAALCVRLPRIEWATGQVETDFRWLPKLRPLLPFAIPVPLARGAPAHGYPWEWGVYEWLDGENSTIDRVDARGVATDLARFLTALQRLDPGSGPPPGRSRGIPLEQRDAETRKAIAELEGEVDIDAVTSAWQAALRAPAWERPPVWLHGDLQPGNLLFVDGRLSAVIDFSAVCVGDPACDAMVAWTFLSAETRPLFRSALGIDDATWARGRGWALSWALIALPYYLETNPLIMRDARRTIAEVLSDEGT